MNNIAGALYRVIKIKNEMKCSRRMRSVSRQCQFKQPWMSSSGNLVKKVIKLLQRLSLADENKWRTCLMALQWQCTAHLYLFRN